VINVCRAPLVSGAQKQKLVLKALKPAQLTILLGTKPVVAHANPTRIVPVAEELSIAYGAPIWELAKTKQMTTILVVKLLLLLVTVIAKPKETPAVVLARA